MQAFLGDVVAAGRITVVVARYSGWRRWTTDRS